MDLPLTGTCQCDSIHYRITERPIVTLVCHCIDCQKLSASAFSLTMAVARQAFVLIRGQLKSWERPTASGGVAICYFCPVCGNRIYHENPDMPDVLRLKPGTLDDTSSIQPDAHVWTKRAQPWVFIPSDIPSYEAQPEVGELLKDVAQSKARYPA
jgi:hypothetical protein